MLPQVVMNRTSDHHGQIEQSFVQLSLYQRTLFLCCATERQYSVYDAFARGKPWANIKQFRSLLDSCWTWAISSGRAKKIELPQSKNFLEINEGQHGSGHAAYPYFSLDYLCEFIADDFINYKNGSREKSISARYGTDIIDGYLYDGTFSKVSLENDLKVFHHPLMRQEIRRQNADLSLLKQKNWAEIDWVEIRSKTKGHGVLEI